MFKLNDKIMWPSDPKIIYRIISIEENEFLRLEWVRPEDGKTTSCSDSYRRIKKGIEDGVVIFITNDLGIRRSIKKLCM